jgi:hypothetical protein
MTPSYLPFADWMKAAGMALIVWGHVAAATTPGLTPPFNLKQLGVAFFVFLSGFTLAREQRPSFQVVFNRWFEVFVIGLCAAVMWSGFALVARGDANPSNFLPLAGGLHLIDDAFPANPTTWYIGTYLHLLVLWAVVLRGRRITGGWLLAWLPVEVALRVAVMLGPGLYVGYMQLGNWVGVLLLGLYLGRRGIDTLPRAALLPAALFIVAWPFALGGLRWELTFPWMSVAGTPPLASAVVVSACVSASYLAYTLSAYALLGPAPASAIVRLLARNTVVVFVAHMPLYYLIEPRLQALVPGYAPRVAVEFVLCYLGLSIAAEGLRRLVDLRALRDRAFAVVSA